MSDAGMNNFFNVQPRGNDAILSMKHDETIQIAEDTDKFIHIIEDEEEIDGIESRNDKVGAIPNSMLNIY